jgi:hypothetical protein
MGGEPLIEWIEVTIDCRDVRAVAEFWRELLGLVGLEDPLPGWMRAAASVPGGPALTFQPVPEPKVGKTRTAGIHDRVAASRGVSAGRRPASGYAAARPPAARR